MICMTCNPIQMLNVKHFKILKFKLNVKHFKPNLLNSNVLNKFLKCNIWFLVAFFVKFERKINK